MKLSYCCWKIIFVVVFSLFFSFGIAKAANVGDVVNFNVDKGFDSSSRIQVPGQLVKITGNLYFYIEKYWWDSQSAAGQSKILIDLDSLSGEFDNKIYPTLTSLFGPESRPGIDKDNRISVLFESINSSEGGYFREADGYAKIQVPTSNEREMFYLSLDKIDDPQLKIILAHELVHLITFNQKNKVFGAEEDMWLNEARADCSSTILGYDDIYDGSNLQQRVKDFIENPSNSLTDWQSTKYDYASVSIFTHYLIDYYGINILAESLKSKYVGIDSINYALQKAGFKDNFSQVFTNWTVAVVLDDCSGGTKYCYLNQNLKNLRISPSLNFLPITGNVSLSVSNVTENWSGNWIKFIGGSGDLRVDFSSLSGLNFRVPYLVQNSGGSYSVNSFVLDKAEKGEINFSKFGTDYKSLIIIPSLQSEKPIFGSNDTAANYPFTYAIYITGSNPTGGQDLIQQLLDRINVLRQEIAKLQGQGNSATCSQLNSNLYFGMSDNNDVRCLQEFLKNQGADIYPEGLVTGNFGSLTKAAVIKFQAKYEIAQTGFVGPLTRTKINQILNGG